MATPKLAEITAARIEQEIVAGGWEPGRSLGSEAELIARFGVSRAVFREAVRLVEHHQLAEMRRGAGGGLIVREPDAAAVSNAMAIYLQYRRVQYHQLYDARMALELWSVEAAIRVLNEPGIERVREYIAEELLSVETGVTDTTYRFHELIADLSGNPVLSLFVRSLTTLSLRQRMREQPLRTFEDVHAVHTKIADAIIHGDYGLARHRMHRHLEAMSTWIIGEGRDDSDGND